MCNTNTYVPQTHKLFRIWILSFFICSVRLHNVYLSIYCNQQCVVVYFVDIILICWLASLIAVFLVCRVIVVCCSVCCCYCYDTIWPRYHFTKFVFEGSKHDFRLPHILLRLFTKCMHELGLKIWFCAVCVCVFLVLCVYLFVRCLFFFPSRKCDELSFL